MKRLQYIFLTLTISLFALSSCQTNESIIDTPADAQESIALRTVLNHLKTDNNINTRTAASSRTTYTPNTGLCFDFVYPFQLEYNNGSQVSVESFDALLQILINENQDLYIIGIVMPFDIIFDDGTVFTISNEEDFIDVLLNECEMDVYDDDAVIVDCFDFVYPFDIIDEDGETLTINTIEEFVEFLEDQDFYYEPLFVFPITLIDSEENEVVIESMYEFLDFLQDCEYDEYYFMNYVGSCFDFVYPLEAIVNGVAIDIPTPNYLSEYFSSPALGSELVFPLDIVDLESNETITVNSMDELEAFIEENCL